MSDSCRPSMSPFALKYLLECYVSYGKPPPRLEPDDDGPPEHDPLRHACNMFVNQGVICAHEPGYRTTPKGDAWVKAILSTPLPRNAFLDEMGREIV